MKKIKKILVLLMVCLMAFSLFAGCGKKENENKSDTIYVSVINKGYGTDWLYSLLDAFCAIHTDYTYEITKAYDDSFIQTNIETGEEYCNYDLAFTGNISPADTKYLLDIKDVYAMTYTSGSRAGKTVKECMDSNVLALLEDVDPITKEPTGSYYRMPWTGGVNGLLVNYSKVTEVMGAGWEETYPCRTTDELLDFCAALKAKGLAPFIHSAITKYYQFLYDGWFAQYNGKTEISDYYKGRYYDEVDNAFKEGPEAAVNDGVLESLKVMESIFANDYSYKDSNGIDWEVCQTYFMLGRSAMFSNGDWNNLEMMKQFPDNDIRFMRLPVISALGDKYGITETQLRTIIDYVDGKTTVKPAVSTGDYTADQLIDIVKEARSWTATYVEYYNTAIPVYSKKAEIAKEFLKFMVTDEGQRIFAKTTKGLTMCYGYDLEENHELYSSLNNFAKSRWNIAKNASYFIGTRREKFGSVGFGPFTAKNLAPIEVLMSRSSDRWSAQRCFDYDYEVARGNWASYIARLK